MAVTDLTSVQNQIQKFWAPMFMKELREQLLLGALVNKEYQGEIKRQGDTVYVSQINAPTGQLLTVGTDADSFDTEEVSMTRIEVKANKRAVAAFEILDLAQLQSQLDAQDSELKTSLMYAIDKQINTYLYSLVAPSTSSPDHSLASVNDMNAAQVNAIRLLASKAKWGKDKGWYLLADPSYWSDILNAATLTSSDYVGAEAPIIGGNIAMKRFGFNMFEDNSSGLLTKSPAAAGADVALAFHPDFMHLCMQPTPSFKLSDLHSQKKFGFVLSVDVVFGAALGIDGAKKHVLTYAT